MAGHHDIRSETATGLVEHIGLACRRNILDDTSIISTKPVIALSINRSGVYIPHLKGVESQKLLDILVQTATITGYPHIAALVEHQLFHGVLADCGGIELVVNKITGHTCLGVYDEEALMV